MCELESAEAFDDSVQLATDIVSNTAGPSSTSEGAQTLDIL